MPTELAYALPDGTPIIMLGARARLRFLSGEVHFHACPNCYDDGPCAMDCEFEEDLSFYDDGRFDRMRGSHALCDACRSF